MKGAAAGFGIITEFVVRTHPEPKHIQHAYHVMSVPYISTLPTGLTFPFSVSLGRHSNLAQNFQNWQSIIGDPGLTRRLASQVILFERGMVIMTTYFGTKQGYDRLSLEERLSVNSTNRVFSFSGVFGTALHLIERGVVRVMGRTVSFANIWPLHSEDLFILAEAVLFKELDIHS